MLLGGDVDNLGDLALPLRDKVEDVRGDLLCNLCSALDLDGVAIGFLLGELDGPCKLSAVGRTAGLDNDVS